MTIHVSSANLEFGEIQSVASQMVGGSYGCRVLVEASETRLGTTETKRAAIDMDEATMRELRDMLTKQLSANKRERARQAKRDAKHPPRFYRNGDRKPI